MINRIYTILNLKYPQIFENKFWNFLDNQIKKDFIPNKYRFFKNPQSIKNWGDHYAEYFDLKNEESFRSRSKGDYLVPSAVFEWYAGNVFHHINSYLRDFWISVDAQYVTDRVKVMEKEITQFKLKENVIVIRIISNDFFKNYLLNNQKLKKGIVLKDMAFLSTSVNLSHRKDSDGIYTPLNDKTVIILKVIKGTHAIYLEHISKKEEFELLLPQGLDIIVEEYINILNNKIILAKVKSK